MYKVYKYSVKSTGSTKIEVPVGAEILSAKNQNEGLEIWALVDGAQTKTREITIRSFVTGLEEVPDPDNLSFIDTVLFQNDRFVVHVFQQLN